MYGLIIENLHYMVTKHFGEELWPEVLLKAGITDPNFSSHGIYSERMVPNLLSALSDIVEMSFHDVALLMGRYFSHYLAQYNYDMLLKVTGRRFADFLKGLDNLHEYFRFSYPKMKAPSFHCEREDREGLILHYRSKRPGYVSYVCGQLVEIGYVFFGVDVTVHVLKIEEKRGVSYIALRVGFDNPDYKAAARFKKEMNKLIVNLPVDSLTFLSMFPWHMVFNKHMVIELAGSSVLFMIPDIAGKHINEEFDLLRPVVRFTFEACKNHLNNIFMMETFRKVKRKNSKEVFSVKVDDMLVDKIDLGHSEEPPAFDERGEKSPEDLDGILGAEVEDKERESGFSLTLKGQMLHIPAADVFVFLATAEIQSLTQMHDCGIFVNDFSIADCNRDVIMATVQQSDDLKTLLREEREKSHRLTSNMKALDIARRETKELLLQMMPASVADQLLCSDEPLNIVEVCEQIVSLKNSGLLRVLAPMQ